MIAGWVLVVPEPIAIDVGVSTGPIPPPVLGLPIGAVVLRRFDPIGDLVPLKARTLKPLGRMFIHLSI